MFSDRYKKIAEQIIPDEKTINEVRERAFLSENKLHKVKLGYIPVFVILLVLLAVPVMGSLGYLDKIDMLLGKNERMDKIGYIESSDEKNGIKISAAGGILSGKNISVYGTVEDLNGKRITEDTKIVKGKIYYNNGKEAAISSIENKGYIDGGVSVFKLGASAEEDINSHVNIEISCMLSDLEEYKKVELPVEVDNSIEVINKEDSSEFCEYGVSIYGDQSEIEKAGYYDSLNDGFINPGNNKILAVEGIDFISIDGAGYINGRLYINMAFKDRLKDRTRVKPYIIDEKGNKTECLWSKSIGISNESLNVEGGYNTDIRDYEQYVFGIGEDEFKSCKVYADVERYNTEINDVFNIEIKSDSIYKNAVAEENVKFGNEVINRLEVTPLYVMAVIENNRSENDYWGELVYDDGNVEEFSYVVSGDNIYEGYGGFVGYTEKYIDMDKLVMININGVTVYEK